MLDKVRVAIVVFVFVCFAWILLDGAASVVSRRERTRFSLRTLLVAVALISMLLGLIATLL